MFAARAVLNTLVSRAVDGTLRASIPQRHARAIQEVRGVESGIGGKTLAGLGILGAAILSRRRGEKEPAPAPIPVEEEAPKPSARDQEALLLVRAMISAANADFEIDDEERRNIIDSCAEMGLSPEARRTLAAEFAMPLSVSMIVDEVRTPELARQVYAASLLAITVDTSFEKSYLEDLAEKLGISRREVAELHDQLGRPQL